MIAERHSASNPSRARRAAVSLTPKPQSIRTRVEPASTMSPLPSLPLPIDAKRIKLFCLFELVLEERENLLAVLRAIGLAFRVLHAYDARRRCFDDLDPILFRLVLLVGFPEHELREPAFRSVLLGHFRIGIGVANEIDTRRAIAVDNGEARAVERE